MLDLDDKQRQGYVKVCNCINELSGTVVSMDAHNKGGGNYKYASLPHLQQVVLPVVKAHGLLLKQDIIGETVRTEMVKVQKKPTESPVDKLMTFAHCGLRTSLIDPETGASESVDVYGDKVDQSSDKSLGAHTVARRYGLMTLFNLIVTDDDLSDPDSSSSDIRNILDGGKQEQRPAPSNPLAGILDREPGKNSDTAKTILGLV